MKETRLLAASDEFFFIHVENFAALCEKKGIQRQFCS